MRNMDEGVRRLFEVGESNTKKHEGRKYDDEILSYKFE